MTVSRPVASQVACPVCKSILTLQVESTPEVNLLSSTTNVGGAYGITRLVAGYNGYAVTIKRSSDNTSQDFGFKSNGELDDAAKTFVSGTVGYITKFYDQSGNANHITGSTLANLANIS